MGNRKRNFGQKLALLLAVGSLVLIPATLGLFVWLLTERGIGDYWVPSALATLIFLGGCAFVLYVISRPKPPLPVESSAVNRSPGAT